MTTARKRRIYHTAVATAETDQRAQIDDNRTAIATDKARLTQQHDEREARINHLESIEQSYRSDPFSSTWTASDHAEAVSAVRLSELAIEGCRKRLAAAERLPTSTDLEVAQSFAEVLKEVYPRFDVVLTFLRTLPPTPPALGDRPLLVVQQVDETRWQRSGAITGDLAVTLYRTAAEVPLDKHALEQAATKAGLVVDIGMVRKDTTAYVDSTRVTVRSAPVTAPVVESIEPMRLRGLAGLIARGVADRYRWRTEGVKHGGTELFYYESSHVVVTDFGTELIEETVADGERRLVIEGAIAVRRLGPDLPEVTLGDAVGQVLEHHRGRFVPWLGSVESIAMLDATSDLDEQASAAMAAATGINADVRTSQYTGDSRAFSFRAVLVSRTALTAHDEAAA